jgi:hypothetical protein
MHSITESRMDQINASLASGIEDARRSLRGECIFAVEQLRMLSAPIAEMESVMLRAAELRAQDPNLAATLDVYVCQLRELQRTLDALRVMLLMQRERVNASRLHLSTVRDWSGALQQTR